MALIFTLASFMQPVQSSVVSFRLSMGLPSLNGPDGVGTGTIAIGQEYLDFLLAPPQIVVVPRSEEIEPTYLHDGSLDSNTPPIPRVYWRGVHEFEAWCWGDEDPAFATTGNVNYSHDSALELRREFCLALAQLGGVAEIGKLHGRWTQPDNVNRLGRLYVLTFQVWTPINDLVVAPTIFQPFATSTSSGVTMFTPIDAVSPDATSTITEATIIAPP